MKKEKKNPIDLFNFNKYKTKSINQILFQFDSVQSILWKKNIVETKLFESMLTPIHVRCLFLKFEVCIYIL
jgi:hypothetical protein